MRMYPPHVFFHCLFPPLPGIERLIAGGKWPDTFVNLLPEAATSFGPMGWPSLADHNRNENSFEHVKSTFFQAATDVQHWVD